MFIEMEKNEQKTQTVEEKLKNLYRLQLVDTEIDRLKITRGELPLEVRDKEAELGGLETRIVKLESELEQLEKMIANEKNAILESDSLIKKYTEQQNNVRNNREYDSLSKEIEYQTLCIQSSEKKIESHTKEIELKKEKLDASKLDFEDKKKDLEEKKNELDDIVNETQKEEEKLLADREKYIKFIEPRLIYAYNRIRNNVRNKLAVVAIERDACGGCFNKIPPQRQLEIKTNRKIIPCEYCGRILVDADLLEEKSD